MDQLILLTPVLVLVIWTFIIFLIMAFGRVSFMNNPQDAADSKDYKNQLPTWVNRTADNYNHLFEQPTVFYAITFTIWGLNETDTLFILCAWLYFFIRLIHSIFQSTLNLVWIRFGLFMFSWVILALMIFRLSYNVFL